jgi:hypothetical protein
MVSKLCVRMQGLFIHQAGHSIPSMRACIEVQDAHYVASRMPWRVLEQVAENM